MLEHFSRTGTALADNKLYGKGIGFDLLACLILKKRSG